MEIITIIVMFLCIIIYTYWSLYCNDKTFSQREFIRLKISTHATETQKIDYIYAYNKVTYKQHHWRLVTFRDPYVLYPDSIRELVDKKDKL